MEEEPEDPEATTEHDVRADLAALKRAVKDRQGLPRDTEAWQEAIDLEERAAARVRRWVSRRCP